MKRILISVAMAVGLVLVTTAPASAIDEIGNQPDCIWGELTAEAIAAGFQQGEHSSSFDTPRVGLANVVEDGSLYATCVLLSP
jgi:hypothetical protein